MSAFSAAEVAARDSYGRLLALLSAATNDVVAAEDALADAFLQAVTTWPSRGVPSSPDAWLLSVARNRLRDWWRSAARQRVEPDFPDLAVSFDLDVDAIPDRRLELMLVCAHPGIDRTVHTPLMLNTVLGYTAAQIGRAFSMPAATMATRLVRAKKRIKTAGIPFRIPGRADLPDRMGAVLEAVYGAYVIDWSTTGPETRPLPSEALHLSAVLAHLAPRDPEVLGLAALVKLSSARASSRTGPDGRFVPLSSQDPASWDHRLIGEAHVHLRTAHALGRLGRFQLEAAIQALHCADNRDPDRVTLLDLHRTLHQVAPTLGGDVALAMATAPVEGPAAALRLLDELMTPAGDTGRRFQPARAARAHLLSSLGRAGEAAAEYDAAIALTHDPAERRYLQERRRESGGT